MHNKSFLPVLLVVLLGGCQVKNQQQTSEETNNRKPMPAIARGTEPFWLLHVVDTTTAVWERPDVGKDTLTIESYTHRGETWILRAQHATYRLQATFSPQTCSDGMSDLEYPLSVKVTIFDSRKNQVSQQYNGCGEYAQTTEK